MLEMIQIRPLGTSLGLPFSLPLDNFNKEEGTHTPHTKSHHNVDSCEEEVGAARLPWLNACSLGVPSSYPTPELPTHPHMRVRERERTSVESVGTSPAHSDAQNLIAHTKRGDVWDRSHSELEVWPSIVRRVPPVEPGLMLVDWVSTPHPRLALVQRRSQTPHTVIVVVKHRSVSSHLRWLVPRHNSSLRISVQVAQFTSHPVAPLISAQLTRCCDLATPDSVALKSCSGERSRYTQQVEWFSLLIDD
jgi:hypothetical protein